jgi:hypothetical protein
MKQKSEQQSNMKRQQAGEGETPRLGVGVHSLLHCWSEWRTRAEEAADIDSEEADNDSGAEIEGEAGMTEAAAAAAAAVEAGTGIAVVVEAAIGIG